jgi:hypothetical protein
MLKKPFAAAAELFRQNEEPGLESEQRKNVCRGLALLADGLMQLEKRIDEMDTELRENPRRPSRFFRRRIATLAAAQT